MRELLHALCTGCDYTGECVRICTKVTIDHYALLSEDTGGSLQVGVTCLLSPRPLILGLSVEEGRSGYREEAIDVNVTELATAPSPVRVLHPYSRLVGEFWGAPRGF